MSFGAWLTRQQGRCGRARAAQRPTQRQQPIVAAGEMMTAHAIDPEI
ncbi:hypothetical protein [Streptomyces sp. NPDC047043]